MGAINREDLKQPANLDAVNAFMRFVDDVTDRTKRKSFANDGTGADVTGIPEALLGALRVMSADELAFLSRLKRVLDDANLYDEYNPKLYYF